MKEIKSYWLTNMLIAVTKEFLLDSILSMQCLLVTHGGTEAKDIKPGFPLDSSEKLVKHRYPSIFCRR